MNTTNATDDNNAAETASSSLTASTGKKKCIFFDYRHSNNAARIRLWLQFKGLVDRDVVETHMLASIEDVTKPDFCQINPCKKIPALITDNGMALFEASVIMSYLEDRFPQNEYAPNFVLDTPDDRARVHLMVRIHDLYIASPNCTQPNTMISHHTQGCMYLDPTPTQFTPARRCMDAPTRAAKLAEIYMQLTWLEHTARCSPYLAGKRLTHADLTWFPTMVYMEFMLPRSFGWSDDLFHEHEHFPQLTRWFEHCITASEKHFAELRQDFLQTFQVQYQEGRLAGVKSDVQKHPEYKWKYM
jgi:glutathione S-transferase